MGTIVSNAQVSVHALRQGYVFRGGEALASISHNNLPLARAVLAWSAATVVLDLATTVGCVTLEGIRGNPSPHRVPPCRHAPHATASWVSRAVLRGLSGSALLVTPVGHPAGPQHLQDPLSTRTLAPVHGACADALAALGRRLAEAVDAFPANPYVLHAACAGRGESAVPTPSHGVLPSANFDSTALRLATDAAAAALAEVAGRSHSRTATLLDPARNGGLPLGLAGGDTQAAASGVHMRNVPLLSAAHAAEAAHAARPRGHGTPHLVADGVEDAATWLSATVAAFEQVTALAQRVVEMELVTALAAVRCRAAAAAQGNGAAPQVGAATAAAERALWGVMEAMGQVEQVWDLADCGATVLEALAPLGEGDATQAAGVGDGARPLLGREGQEVEEPIPRCAAPAVVDPGQEAPGDGFARVVCGVRALQWRGSLHRWGGMPAPVEPGGDSSAARHVVWAEGGVPPVPLGLAAQALADVGRVGKRWGRGERRRGEPDEDAGRGRWQLPPLLRARM